MSGWLHPEWTRERAYDFAPLVEAAANGREALQTAYEAIPLASREWAIRILADGRVPLLTTAAFTVPVMSPEACADLVTRSQCYDWKENDIEEAPYRIPESILAKVDPDANEIVNKLLRVALAPWFLLIWGKLPSRITSIQMAKYNPADRAGGNWHSDRDSNFTAVISLSPESFSGGGTELRDGLLSTVTVPPLPAGHALVFDGRRISHQGLPVTEGDRHLLVIWSNDDPEC
ncbi:2OG-Fe(II) oxygenase family protein [Flavisphingomonas formosensis]|uniref:2OG-Fe(II) oxygenase n=1 Tax=Flavisphingomonas formosensis TaxID=861534 RepID=UPI0018DFF5B4|nr:2OG-Fe(II) oxygenase [Sphingomonas formosensis]